MHLRFLPVIESSGPLSILNAEQYFIMWIFFLQQVTESPGLRVREMLLDDEDVPETTSVPLTLIAPV